MRVEGAIYAAAWYREYRALWDRRNELLSPERAEGLEAQDDMIRQSLKALGADVLPSELISQLGSSWRAVVAGGAPDYAVEPIPALPGVGIVVSLRDAERFEALAAPALRGVRLVAAFGGAKMQPFQERSTDDRPALSGLRFADGPGADRTGDLARFNVAPTWAVHREHFVIASTRPLARALLTALDDEAADPRPLPPGVTESQRLNPAALATLLESAGPSIRLGMTSDGGFDAAEADGLLAAVAAALRSLGPVTVTTRTDRGLLIEVALTAPEVRP